MTADRPLDVQAEIKERAARAYAKGGMAEDARRCEAEAAELRRRAANEA
jgi:hypothetical protein